MIASDMLLSLLFGIMAICSIWWSQFVYGDGFAPLGIYLTVTFSSLALWNLKLVALVQLSGFVYSIIFLSVIGFIFGAFIAAPGTYLRGNRVTVCQYPMVNQKGLKTFFYVIGILSTIGWIVLLINFSYHFSLSTVWEEPYKLQPAFQTMRFVGYLNLLGILVLPTYVLFRKSEKKGGKLSFLLVISSFVGLLLAGIKSYLFFSVVTSLFAWGGTRRRGTPLRYMMTSAVCLIIFMILYDHVIDIFVAQHGAESILNTVAPTLYRPYLYTVGSWSALTVAINDSVSQSFLASFSLGFLWKILGNGFGIINPVQQFTAYSNIAAIGHHDFNVYSMAGGLFFDYGLTGVLIGSVFWGGISTYFFLIARKSRKWTSILGSSVINYGLFLSFFTYYFTFNLLFLLAIIFLAVLMHIFFNNLSHIFTFTLPRLKRTTY